MNMTKPEVRKALGLETDSQLADLLGVTRSAISQWPDDAPIPMPRQWQLMAMRPDVFSAQTEQRTEDTQRPEQKRAA